MNSRSPFMCPAETHNALGKLTMQPLACTGQILLSLVGGPAPIAAHAAGLMPASLLGGCMLCAAQGLVCTSAGDCDPSPASWHARLDQEADGLHTSM